MALLHSQTRRHMLNTNNRISFYGHNFSIWYFCLMHVPCGWEKGKILKRITLLTFKLYLSGGQDISSFYIIGQQDGEIILGIRRTHTVGPGHKVPWETGVVRGEVFYDTLALGSWWASNWRLMAPFPLSGCVSQHFCCLSSCWPVAHLW